MNRQIVSETADFRVYSPEICDDETGRLPMVMRLCEDKVGSRWEPFYSTLPLNEALVVLKANGYDIDRYR